MIVRADARRIPLPDESVQCVVTSPPYWGLRKYKGDQELIWLAWSQVPQIITDACAHEWTEENISAKSNWETFIKTDGSAMKRKESIEESSRFSRGTCARCGSWRGGFGLEPTVEMYVAHTVEILREIRRVLRRDGVVFWNIGDSYQSGNRGTYDKNRVINADSLQSGFENQDDIRMAPNRLPQDGLKPKDLCLIPARVALAAQADSWWVRSLIIWSKPNPMPESVTDRPTDAYEHILMLTKSERYFWDAEAVKEPAVCDGIERADYKARETDDLIKKDFLSRDHVYPSRRNLRNVWTFPTQAYSGAHFATFPEEIPRRAILAATSARGACIRCGAPWRRITEPSPEYARILEANESKPYDKPEGVREFSGPTPSVCAEYETVGWQPTCECEKETGRLPETRPCLILDPFGGSGTTGRVAIELNRRAVLLDLAYSAEAYAPLAIERLRDVQREMFA